MLHDIALSFRCNDVDHGDANALVALVPKLRMPFTDAVKRVLLYGRQRQPVA